MEWELIASVSYWIFFVVLVAHLVQLGAPLHLYQMLIGLPRKCEGFAAPEWNRVAEVFKRLVEGGHHRGGGFAVYHKGQLVVEFVGGYADYESEWPWDKTTLFCLFECTKGIGAIVIAILVDRGVLDYSSPVANYWPEFAENGKGSITVEQLLSHQAGLIVLNEVYSLFDILRNPEKMSHLLATARPQWEPGSKHGFHTMTLGLYMDQLVRRVDPHHRRLDQFFAEEVSRKFGIDCFIGLPKEEYYRCARLQGFPLRIFYDMLMTPKYWKCVYSGFFGWNSNLVKFWTNYAEAKKKLWNNPAFHEIPSASTNGYATVAGVAKLYGIIANGGHLENQTLLSPPAVEKLNESLVSGMDCVYFVNATIGRGNIIMKSEDGDNIFGHTGFCGQAVFADPKHRVGWAYITNYPSIFHCGDDWRYLELIKMVYETIRELERQEYTD